MASHDQYESVVDHHCSKSNLEKSQLQEKCSENVLVAVASKMTRWRNMEPHLQLDQGVVDDIDKGSYDEEGKKRELLYRWRERYGHKATYEKLIRCLMNASRADLADVVCEEVATCAIVDTPSKSTHEPTATDSCIPFSTPQPDMNHEILTSSRDIPPPPSPPPHETLRQRKAEKYSESPTSSLSTASTQEVGSSPSRLVGQTGTTTVIPGSNNSYFETFQSFGQSLAQALSLAQQEKNEKSEIKQDLKEKMEKINALEARQKETEEEVCKAQSELESQRIKQTESEEDLTQKEKKIKWLQENVYQKETELKCEKDEKQETNEKILEMETKLHQAKAELESEKRDKESAEEVLDQVSTRIKTLETDMEKANRTITETRTEREKVNGALEKTKRKLDDEKRAANESKSKLKKQTECMAIWVFIAIAFVAIVLALFLRSMGILQ